ncbi:SDR family NAD(P)-dependent oxidoreductase, partial [Angustibacter aerolatus]
MSADGTPKDLAGRVCLVTGGATGPGRAVSRELGARGGHVVVAWSDDPAATAATVDDVRTAGGSAEEVRADVTDADRLAALVAQVGGRHERLDVLEHATAHEAPAEGGDPDWQRALDAALHEV